MAASKLSLMAMKDGGDKKKKPTGKQVINPYGKYSGIINDKGETVDNPKESEAVSTMVNYMKNNQSSQTTRPSNVYRPDFSHLGINYDRKKKQSNA